MLELIVESSVEFVQDLNYRLDMDLIFFTFLPMNREPTKIGHNFRKQNSLTIKLVKKFQLLSYFNIKENHFHEHWTDFQHYKCP